MKPEQRIQAEKERALEWLNDKWKGARLCQICGTANWTVADVVELRPYEGGNMVIGGGRGTFPVFQVICSNCGNTHLINAALSGVVVQGEYENDPRG